MLLKIILNKIVTMFLLNRKCLWVILKELHLVKQIFKCNTCNGPLDIKFIVSHFESNICKKYAKL